MLLWPSALRETQTRIYKWQIRSTELPPLGSVCALPLSFHQLGRRQETTTATQPSVDNSLLYWTFTGRESRKFFRGVNLLHMSCQCGSAMRIIEHRGDFVCGLCGCLPGRSVRPVGAIAAPQALRTALPMGKCESTLWERAMLH